MIEQYIIWRSSSFCLDICPVCSELVYILVRHLSGVVTGFPLLTEEPHHSEHDQYGGDLPWRANERSDIMTGERDGEHEYRFA